MSADDHQMERGYSAPSVSSDEGSDTRSEFRMESVVYMSSCAATVFVGALAILGILLMTLLTTLTMMLQSCKNREAGVIESSKCYYYHHHRHNHDYDYCKMAAFNSEINSFDAYYVPDFCKDAAVKYIKEGHYMTELNSSMSLVENYFHDVMPHDDGHDVVLMDIDDFFPANSLRTNAMLYGCKRYGYDDCVREAKHMKHVFLIELYIKLESGGWPLVLLSRKHEQLRDATVEDLKSAGCRGWSRLIMRSEEDMKMDTHGYLVKQKMAIEAEGYRIRGVISSHMDMLVGGSIKTQNFKLPNTLPVAPTHAII